LMVLFYLARTDQGPIGGPNDDNKPPDQHQHDGNDYDTSGCAPISRVCAAIHRNKS
jgi:hypothetical protein